MRVKEIFTSIQGEGVNIGRQCTFIRTVGCNLDCPWCDTNYSRQGGEVLDMGSILNGLTCPPGLVVITGGEPLLQPDIIELTEALLEDGYQVAIETNGTIKKVFDEGVWVTVSPKPGSNYEILIKPSEIKLVVSPELSRAVVAGFDNAYPDLPKILQPCAGFEDSVGRCLNFQKVFPNWRVLPQLHKLWKLK